MSVKKTEEREGKREREKEKREGGDGKRRKTERKTNADGKELPKMLENSNSVTKLPS